MPYNVLRALSYKKYLDYTEWEIDRFKEFGRPRKWVVHDQQLFELWKEEVERKKKAAEKVRPGQVSTDQKDSSDETSQKVLTEEFFAYFRDVLERDIASQYFELCTSKQMNMAYKYRTLFNDSGDPLPEKDDMTMFEREKQGLDGLVDFAEWIFTGKVT